MKEMTKRVENEERMTERDDGFYVNCAIFIGNPHFGFILPILNVNCVESSLEADEANLRF